MFRSHRNSICDTCVQISRSYEFFDVFAYIVVISSKTVKSAKNTIFDGDLTVSRLITTVSAKTVKSAKNTICDTFAQNSWRYEFSDIFSHTVVIRSENVTKHKTPRLLCTSVTNRLLR